MSKEVAMLKYSRATLEEKELESRIIRVPELIEEGLTYLEHQRGTGEGRLDILFVDANKTLVVAELKVVEDLNMLFQALDYFDFVNEKIDGFARIHSKKEIDTNKFPRLMLIAPSFSPIMMKRCRWLNPEISITLITFQYIKFDDKKEDTIIFIPQDITVAPTRIKKAPELQALLNYITVSKSRELAKKILEETEQLSDKISIDPLQWGRSVKYQGGVLYYWSPRQPYVKISINDEDGNWKGIDLVDENSYQRIMKLIKGNIEKYWG
jgi:hypothetical protein